MLSNYQFDKYLSAGTDENGDEKLKLPLEQIFLDASAEFQQVRSTLWSALRPAMCAHTLMRYTAQNVAEQVTVGQETVFARNLGTRGSLPSSLLLRRHVLDDSELSRGLQGTSART